MDHLLITLDVAGGKCQWTTDALERIKNYLWRFDGRKVQVRFEPPKRTRSTRQNSYLWGVCYSMIANETGHDPEEVHKWMSLKFLPRQFITIAGEEQEVTKSTTGLDTREFEIYTERVRAFAAQELGLNIPLPNEL